MERKRLFCKTTCITVMLCLFSTLSLAETTIIFGPGFQKNQQSSRKLKYEIPANWITDRDAIEKTGLYDILVPKNRTMETADSIITIAFHEKDKSKPVLSNLESFFTVDMANLLQQFPDAQSARWQPSMLDPNKIHYMSIERFGPGQQPSPHRILFLDAGDGYYTLSLTVKERDMLDLEKFVNFFNSIRF